MLRLKEDTDSSRRQNSSAGRLREIAINNVLCEYPFRSYSDVPFSRKGHILRVIDALVLVPETPAIIEAHEFYDTKKRTKEEDVARHRRFYSIYGPHFYTVLIGLHNRRDLERRIKTPLSRLCDEYLRMPLDGITFGESEALARTHLKKLFNKLCRADGCDVTEAELPKKCLMDIKRGIAMMVNNGQIMVDDNAAANAVAENPSAQDFTRALRCALPPESFSQAA